MRKNLCIVLILLICFTTTFTYIVKGTDEDENSNTTTSSTDLQTQKELLQKQLDEANKYSLLARKIETIRDHRHHPELQQW